MHIQNQMSTQPVTVSIYNTMLHLVVSRAIHCILSSWRQCQLDTTTEQSAGLDTTQVKEITVMVEDTISVSKCPGKAEMGCLLTGRSSDLA